MSSEAGLQKSQLLEVVVRSGQSRSVLCRGLWRPSHPFLEEWEGVWEWCHAEFFFNSNLFRARGP